MEHTKIPTRNGEIRLGQFLKLANLIDSGADAKHLIAAQVVQVNGAIESRRGRRLVRGDVVTFNDETFEVD